jgi:hypothetical protein
MVLAVTHLRLHTSFATVINVMKLQTSGKTIGIPEGKYSQTFQSRLAGDKWLTPIPMLKSTKCQTRN